MPDAPDSSSQPTLEEIDKIVSQVGRLRPGNPVRRPALSVIRGEALETIAPLINALLNPAAPRWRERETAAWALGHTPLDAEEADSATATLLDVLENSPREPLLQRAARTVGRAVVAAGGLGLAGSALYLLYRIVAHNGYYWWESVPSPRVFFVLWPLLIGLCSLPLTLSGSYWYGRTRKNRVRAAAAAALGHRGAVESAGVLAGALFVRSAGVREAAAAALHDLLPAITAEHYGVLGAESMRSLGRALNHPDSHLVFKVLAALEKVGTSHAVIYVERAAQGGRTVRLRDAASQVLKTLQERQRRENQRDTLLRPTATPDDPAAILLRPAHDSGSTHESLLVRPAASENRDGG